MTKRLFKTATEIAVFAIVTPLAWWVYTEATVTLQAAFLISVSCIAYFVRRFVYQPISKRLPDESIK